MNVEYTAWTTEIMSKTEKFEAMQGSVTKETKQGINDWEFKYMDFLEEEKQKVVT